MGKTDLFTQFYPDLPNWFYPMGKTYHANTGATATTVTIVALVPAANRPTSVVLLLLLGSVEIVPSLGAAV